MKDRWKISFTRFQRQSVESWKKVFHKFNDTPAGKMRGLIGGNYRNAKRVRANQTEAVSQLPIIILAGSLETGKTEEE